MANRKLITLLLFGILLIVNSCDYVDIPDMFVSPSSVNDRYEQSMEWNATHPFQKINVATEDYLIMNMADSHVGETANFITFLTASKDKNATAIVINGDFCSGHTSDYNTFDAILPPQDSLKSFLTAGNHELYFDGWSEFYNRYGSSMYYFSIKTPTTEDMYICLDTGSGTLGSKQLSWFKKLLINERAKYRHCIIFTHVNLFRSRHTGSTNPNMEELYVLLDLFAKYHIDMVISGHDHIRYEEKIGNTTHLSIDALKDGLSNVGYLELHINNSAVNYTFTDI